MTAARVTGREELVFLLNQAAELEHSLCCSYFFTALSLKSRPEDGLAPDELEATTRWKRVFGRVAVDEMNHLAMVNNLLVALGAAPNLDRPNFPHGCSYYMPDIHIQLRPFSEETMMHFVAVEQPADENAPPPSEVDVLGDLDNENDNPAANTHEPSDKPSPAVDFVNSPIFLTAKKLIDFTLIHH